MPGVLVLRAGCAVWWWAPAKPISYFGRLEGRRMVEGELLDFAGAQSSLRQNALRWRFGTDATQTA